MLQVIVFTIGLIVFWMVFAGGIVVLKRIEQKERATDVPPRAVADLPPESAPDLPTEVEA
jgi:hypothetical protein